MQFSINSVNVFLYELHVGFSILNRGIYIIQGEIDSKFCMLNFKKGMSQLDFSEIITGRRTISGWLQPVEVT